MRSVAIGVFVVSMLAAACGDAATEPAPADGSGSLPSTTRVGEVSTTDAEAPSPTVEPAISPATSAPTSLAPVPPGVDVERAPVDTDAPVDELVAGWNDAGFELLRRLPGGDNVVFSPASIGHALQMAAAAGDDTTRAAIEAAFGLPTGSHEAWNNLDHQIADTQSEQVTVTIADRIWPRTGIAPDQQWVDLLAAQHGSDVVPLDFANDRAGSREVINDWVAERTEGLIPDLLPEGFIQPQTVLVLTDTVYFAADWARPFGKYGPVDGTFTTIDGDEVDVSFMQELELDDRRGTGDGFVGAEIPYAGDDYSMLVLVPDADRYDELIDRLDQQLLDDIDATFTTGPYELLLPKWDDEYQIDLLDWLTELGAAPGNPKITDDAFLDAAVHAADIAVDEIGTVAAAATGLGFAESGPPEPELTVAADRPFIYLIRHRDSGLVLFAGHVTNPA
jgi:serpin B